MRHLLVLALLLCSVNSAWAQSLAGRSVLLVVTQEREDASARVLADRLIELREQLGLKRTELPLVFMGFSDSEVERLGFSAKDAPVVTVVRWGTTENSGPARVMGPAIRRQVEVDDPDPYLISMLRDWLNFSGRSELVARLPGPREGGLHIAEWEVMARGEPLYMGTVTMILKNDEPAPTVPSMLELRYRPIGDQAWRILSKSRVPAIRPGASHRQGEVFSLRKIPELLDENSQVVPFELEVLVDGQRVGNWSSNTP